MMIDSIKEDALEFVFRVQPLTIEKMAETPARERSAPLQFLHPEATSALKNAPSLNVKSISPAGEGEFIDAPVSESRHKPVVNSDDKIGRNDPCPCGSGKKYKKCHGS